MKDKKKAVTEARGILRQLDSLMLIAQDSAEKNTDLDPSVFADALDVMRRLVRKVDKALESTESQQV